MRFLGKTRASKEEIYLSIKLSVFVVIMARDLKNKVVVITGSSIGIGRETSYKFAEEGCRVVVTYCEDEKRAEEVAERCSASGASSVLLINLDVTSDESIRKAVKKIVEEFGGISVLVNNAGIVISKPLSDQSFEDIEKQVRTNLEGLIKMTKECLPHIKDVIINVSSGAGLEGHGNLTTYCATKFGVRGFSQALGNELSGVEVYTMYPPVTSTRMSGFRGASPEIVAEVIVKIAKGEYTAPSGGDIKFWEVARQPKNE